MVDFSLEGVVAVAVTNLLVERIRSHQQSQVLRLLQIPHRFHQAVQLRVNRKRTRLRWMRMRLKMRMK